MELRANTAVDILVGPILDSVAATEEAGETIAQANVLLSKNGQTLAQKNDNTTCAFDDHGCYNCELDATDTNTVGILTVVIFMAGTMIYRGDYSVICEAEYDRKYSSQGSIIGQIQSVTADTPSSGITQIGISDPGLSSAADNQFNGWTLHVLDRSTREVLDSGTIGDHTDSTNLIYVDDLSITPTTSMDYRLDVGPKSSPTAGDLPAVQVTDYSTAGVVAFLDEASLIDGYTVRQVLAALGAACAGKISGAAGTAITIRSIDDNHDRITATVDANGNRSAVTISTTGIS